MTEKPKRKEKNTSRLSNPVGCSLMLIFGGVGILCLFSYWLVNTPFVESCEIFVNDSTGYRTTTSRGFGAKFVKYQMTHDGGDTWVTFYEIYGSRLDYDAFHNVSETFYWVLPRESHHPTVLFVTHDAGKTWIEWSSHNIEGLSWHCTIENVYLSLIDGSMQVECRYSSGRYNESRNYNFLTNDGGLTWNIANE